MNYSSSAQDPAYGAELRKIHVIQGQFHVAEGEDVVLTTILGSCVAASIRDPVLGIGGMNHFLLPGSTGDEGLRYGSTGEAFSLYLSDPEGNGLELRA